MDSINQRISFLIEELGYNRNSFAKALDKESSIEIQNIAGKRNTKPSPDILSRIMRKFPEINADWLLTGRGRPFKVNPKKENILKFREKFDSELADKYMWDSDINDKTIILQQECEVLKAKLDASEKQLADKDKVITTMQRLIDFFDKK